MANESVSFTINADTRPAGKALLELSRLINKAITADTSGADKNIIAQQKEYKKLGTVVRGVFKDIKRLNDEDKAKGGKAQLPFNQYAANEKKIANLESQKETITDAKELASINAEIKKYKDANATMDKYAEQVLKQILGSEKTIVADEKSVLGIKTLTTDKTQETASAEEDLVNKTKQTNENLKETANSAKAASDAIKNATNKANTAQADTATAQVKETEESVENLASVAERAQFNLQRVSDAMKMDTANNNIAELVRRLQILERAKRELEKAWVPEGSDKTYNEIIYKISEITQQIQEYKRNLRGVSEGHRDVAKSGKQLGVLSSLIATIQKGFKEWHRNNNKVKRSFDSMARSMRSHFKHLITGITKYVLGFRSLFFLVRRLRRYLGEGIKNLAQFNNGNNLVNESITDLLSSLLYLKNAWAAAFSPIITAVRPYLVALLDDLAAVGNTIAKFLSSLFGQTVAFNAVRVRAADYADSLDKVGGSAGSAADKTKKLTDRLAAFDDLNVLGVDKDPDGTGSGGGGGLANAYTPDPNEMFKIVDPERNGFLSALKNAWETANFRGVGIIIRKKLLELLDIDWENAQEKAKQIGSAIGQFLNGLFGSPEFWEAIGTGLGESFNTITYGIQSFLEATSGVDFGGSIAKGLNEFFRTTDFETMGQNVNEIFTQLTDNINSFVDNLDSDELANKLSEFIEGLDIGDIVAKANECLLKVASLVLEVTGKVIANEGEKLGEKWWNEVTEGIDTKIGEIPVTLEPTIDATEHPVQALIDNWLTKIGEDVMKTPLSIGSLTAKSMGIDADEVDVINMVSERWEEFWSDFESGCNTVKDTMSDSSTSLINSMDAIMPKITELKDTVTSSWEKIKTDTEEKWTAFKTTITNKATEIKSSVTQKINDLRDALSNKWQEIKDAAWTKFTLLRVAIVDIFTQLKDAVKVPINGFIGVIESMVNKVITGVNKVIDALNTLPDIKFTNPFTGTDYALGITLPKLSQITIPRLAQGAVIPPNREFMAVLGDQSHGTNIEAPLDVIKQAVAEVLANNGNAEVIQLLQQLIAVVESKNLTIGDKEIGKANARYVSQQQIVRGTGW